MNIVFIVLRITYLLLIIYSFISRLKLSKTIWQRCRSIGKIIDIKKQKKTVAQRHDWFEIILAIFSNNWFPILCIWRSTTTTLELLIELTLIDLIVRTSTIKKRSMKGKREKRSINLEIKPLCTKMHLNPEA